jgi:FlaG/FlaF family flagellin (archaellin)
MRTLRQLSVALVFTLALTIPAFADGQIDTGLAPPPPPSQSQTATTNGGIETGLTGQDETGSSEATVTGSAANAAVNLIQSALSLL